jgi:hypothetical protein
VLPLYVAPLAIQTVLTYTDDARRHFSSASHRTKARLSVVRPHKTKRIRYTTSASRHPVLGSGWGVWKNTVILRRADGSLKDRLADKLARSDAERSASDTDPA